MSTAVRRVTFLAHPLAADAAIRLQSAARSIGLKVDVAILSADGLTETAAAGATAVVQFDAEPHPHPHATETWPADPAALPAEVNELVARLFTGARRGTLPPPVPVPAPVQKVPKPPPPPTVKISRETKGRRGKGVTIVSDLPAKLGVSGRAELAAILKSRCGTGGTVTDTTIEIQGDMRERLAAELVKLGYKVKQAGG